MPRTGRCPISVSVVPVMRRTSLAVWLDAPMPPSTMTLPSGPAVADAPSRPTERDPVERATTLAGRATTAGVDAVVVGVPGTVRAVEAADVDRFGHGALPRVNPKPRRRRPRPRRRPSSGGCGTCRRRSRYRDTLRVGRVSVIRSPRWAWRSGSQDEGRGAERTRAHGPGRDLPIETYPSERT